MLGNKPIAVNSLIYLFHVQRMCQYPFIFEEEGPYMKYCDDIGFSQKISTMTHLDANKIFLNKFILNWMFLKRIYF